MRTTETTGGKACLWNPYFLPIVRAVTYHCWTCWHL